MDSDDVIFVVASLCDCLKVCHHKTSDILRLALYQIINGNWQNYEQVITPKPQIYTIKRGKKHWKLFENDDFSKLARVGYPCKVVWL